MWTNIIGALFAGSGLLMATNPARMRRKLQRHSLRAIRRIFAAAAIAAGALLLSAASQETGWTQHGLTGAGLLALAKAVFFLKAKSAEILSERIQNIPDLYLRILALAQAAFGAWLIMHETPPEG